MSVKRASRSLALAMVVIAVSNVPVQAQQTVSRHYRVTPKDGMVAQFESALKAHVQWRADNSDPWTWGVATVEVGENLGTYNISSFGHTWADFDAYDAGFGPQGLMHWNATVAPLVESVSSSISTTDPSISNPLPDGTPLAFVTITVFQVRPGSEIRFQQAIAEGSNLLKEHGYGAHWVWSTDVTGGGPGPRVSLVALYPNWASMQEPDPSFESILMQEMGQDDFMEWNEALSASIRGVEAHTLRIRPDLGVNQN